jgi:hypothetical protein
VRRGVATVGKMSASSIIVATNAVLLKRVEQRLAGA